MQVGIQTRGFDLTAALHNYCERRLRFALGSASGRVRSVLVRLTDENGPKEGIDKRCSIRVVLHDAPVVVVTQDETDIYFAIDRAVDRVSRTISHRRNKVSTVLRAPGQGRRDSSDSDVYQH